MADTVTPAAQGIVVRHFSNEELENRRAANAALIELARPHLEWLSRAHQDVPHVTSLVDREGVVLFTTGKHLDIMRNVRLPAMGAPVHAPDGAIIAAVKLSVGTDGESPSRLFVVAHIAFAIGQQLKAREAVRPAA